MYLSFFTIFIFFNTIISSFVIFSRSYKLSVVLYSIWNGNTQSIIWPCSDIFGELFRSFLQTDVENVELKTPGALLRIRKEWSLDFSDDDYETKFMVARKEAAIKWLEVNANEFGFSFREEAIV